MGTYLRVHIFKRHLENESLCGLVALCSFFILGFALLKKELLHFAISTGQWHTGCLADVEGGPSAVLLS